VQTFRKSVKVDPATVSAGSLFHTEAPGRSWGGSERLNKEINAGLADPKIKTRLVDLGGEVLPLSPADFGRLIAARPLLRGERLIGYAPHEHWKTITFVAGPAAARNGSAVRA
jgi:hypothetical protein